jgi:predicted phosphodiesterase
MRFFALSDIHVDYPENMQWVKDIDAKYYQQDILILAGDVTDDLGLLSWVFDSLKAKFSDVLFVPGNHELWLREEDVDCSLEKFTVIERLCLSHGIKTDVTHYDQVSVVPLYSWYDYSFGEPDRHLLRGWRDFRACRWPAALGDMAAVSNHFLSLNGPRLQTANETVISFSHFLPRIDVMPAQIPNKRRVVYPVLGSTALGDQIATLAPDIHIYGHSHVNRSIKLGATRFVNNAFAYPAEERIARKQMHCVLDTKAAVA